ncbi:hypothetical protein Pth03_00430 [Planotetraspora thailandica]|uniref:Uncharacterized protein n=2 Tax=Planotetraspora thailandica TaxID=487172 RepID=A0A8J3UTB9_9ACTN|nr:hypothetical protein Pth03_00430 [Planotetraspora thailandica]
MDLDGAADRLYGLPPGEFVAARDALAKEAKAAEDAGLARQIAALRRPTVVGWAVNQASRRHPDELDDLLDVGARLRDAWQRQDAGELAALTRERSAATARLTRLIRQDAEESGQPLTGAAATEIEQTLDAAVVDETAAEQVRQGRLVRGLSYSGFAPAPAATKARPSPKAREAKKGASRTHERAAERQAAERRRRELDRALADARRAAEEAEEGHAAWEAELAQAVQDRDSLAEDVAELAGRLAAAKDRLEAAGHRLDVARREEGRARRAAEAARARAGTAEAAVRDAPSITEA